MGLLIPTNLKSRNQTPVVLSHHGLRKGSELPILLRHGQRRNVARNTGWSGESTTGITYERYFTKRSSYKDGEVWFEPHLNPLKTNGRLLYLKTQFVSRSKHFSSRL